MIDLLPLDFSKSNESEKMEMMKKLTEQSEDLRDSGYFTSLFTGGPDNINSESGKERLKELLETLNLKVFG